MSSLSNSESTWTPLPSYGFIEVSGQDAASFLQGQLTSDIQEITASQSRLGAYCNHKGRIRSLMRIFKYNGAYLLRLPYELLERTLSTLKKYQLRAKITLENVSQKWQSIGIKGNNCSFFFELNGFKQPLHVDEAITHENQVVIRVKGTIPRFELYCSSDTVAHLKETLSSKANQNEENTWHLYNIQSGIPEIYPKTSELFLPHNVNLPELNAVSFKKGCYCGQEIIARMQHRTTVKRHTFRASFQARSLPGPGTELALVSVPDKVIGSIVMAAPSQNNQYEALVEISDEYAKSNTIQIMHFDGASPLVILPFE